jgi:hypothetical protein
MRSGCGYLGEHVDQRSTRGVSTSCSTNDLTGDASADASPSESSALISAKDDLIATLREQLLAERQAHAEARRLLAAALERIPPQLEAGSQSNEDAPESPSASVQGKTRPFSGNWDAWRAAFSSLASLKVRWASS